MENNDNNTDSMELIENTTRLLLRDDPFKQGFFHYLNSGREGILDCILYW